MAIRTLDEIDNDGDIDVDVLANAVPVESLLEIKADEADCFSCQFVI